MPFVNAKCTNCGGTLQVDSTGEAAICQYCASPFIVEKAINNYNSTHHHHISNSVVNIYEQTQRSKKDHYEKGYSYLKIGELDKSIDQFKEALCIDPDDEELIFIIAMMVREKSWNQALAESYAKKHPQIEDWEKKFLNTYRAHAHLNYTYFRTFFEGGYDATDHLIDSNRCEYYCVLNGGGIPNNFGNIYSLTSETFVRKNQFASPKYRYRSREQLEFLFYHDCHNIIKPYNKIKIVPYTKSDIYVSPYEYARGRLIPPNATSEPENGANEAVAQLIEKYYTKPSDIANAESGRCRFCGGKIGFFGSCKNCGK